MYMQNVPPEAQNIVRFALLLSVSRECAIFNFPMITMLNFNIKKKKKIQELTFMWTATLNILFVDAYQ